MRSNCYVTNLCVIHAFPVRPVRRVYHRRTKGRIPRHRHRHPRRHPREDVGDGVGVVECGLNRTCSGNSSSEAVHLSSIHITAAASATATAFDKTATLNYRARQ